MAVGALEPRFYAALREVLGLPWAPDRADPQNWAELRALFAARFSERTRDEQAAAHPPLGRPEDLAADSPRSSAPFCRAARPGAQGRPSTPSSAAANPGSSAPAAPSTMAASTTWPSPEVARSTSAAQMP